MLRILSNVASAVSSLLSPASSTRANAPSSLASSNIDVSSIASTPTKSLLFQEEEEEQTFLLPPIDELMEFNHEAAIRCVNALEAQKINNHAITDMAMKQSKELPHVKDLQILHITTAQDGWGKIDERWGPLPQPNGWEHPSAKPYTVDDFPILPLPPSTIEDSYSDDEEEDEDTVSPMEA